MPKPIIQLRCAVVSAPKGVGDTKALMLRVELDPRPYLLGEPILMRCMLINGTDKPLTIPYNDWGFAGAGRMDPRIRAPNGRLIGRPKGLNAPLTLGHAAFTVDPGKQFVVTMDMRYEYTLVNPATYQVTVEYHSDGKLYRPDPDHSGRLKAFPAWAGNLTADAGQIEVQRPSSKDDKAALENLLTGMVYRDGKLHSLTLMLLYCNSDTEDIRRRLVDDFPNSRYTAYIRYYNAEVLLEKWDWTPRPEDASAAAKLLEGIDRDQYPKLFQEMVLHRLIHARVLAGVEPTETAKLAKQFREQFPHSPYVLPPALSDTTDE